MKRYMNSIELKNQLLKMVADFFNNENKDANRNMNPCYYVSIVDVIMGQYMIRCDYYEEDAIATMDRFLKKGVLSW